VKVTVLGGGAAGGNSGQGCAGFLFQESATSLVIDLGPGTLLELRKHVDYRQVSAIVVSHYHLDHILDLGALNYLLRYNPVGLACTVDLWIPPGTRQRFANWTAAFGNEGEDDFLDKAFVVREYDPRDSLHLEDLRVSFASTVHPEPAWAMRVSGGAGRNVGYSADTGPAADLSPFMSGVDLLICEASEKEPAEDDPSIRGHLTPREAGALASRSGAHLLMLTHLWEEHNVNLAAREASFAFGKPVLVAQPGLQVTL
jgi:ribonuclease BN (tRNA processing enzyme)